MQKESLWEFTRFQGNSHRTYHASRSCNRWCRRIGATIVNSLIDDGWAVIVHCNRSLTQARQLIQRGQGAIVSGDLSNDEDLFRIIEEIHDHELVEKAGGIDLLVHNASIYNQEDFSTVTPQELRRFSSIHLDAPFSLLKVWYPN